MIRNAIYKFVLLYGLTNSLVKCPYIHLLLPPEHPQVDYTAFVEYIIDPATRNARLDTKP